jgi:hypothetical protein
LRRLILAGLFVASVACLALFTGLASRLQAPVPPAAPASAAHAGFVCRSAHFTLTAEIHVGS